MKGELTGRLAMYLSKYPMAKVWWCGALLDPSEVIQHQHEEALQLSSGAEGTGPVLRIVEWKTKPPRRELLVCDAVGVHRITLRAGIQAPDFDFTAYVLWDKFAGLTDHDMLEGEFEQSDSLLGRTVEAARARLRSYFRERERDRAKELIEKWVEEGVYPYAGEPAVPVDVAEREAFDSVAVLVSRHLQGSKQARRTQMVLLREALRRQPHAMPKVLDELFGLTGAQKERLEDLVERTPLANLVAANAQAVDRIDFLAMLRSLLFEPQSRTAMREVDQLHPMLEKELWVFGDEYASAVSEVGLTEALERALGRRAGVPRQQVRRADGRGGRLDLMLSAVSGAGQTKRHLVVELKRPSVTLGEKELAQVRSYAFTVSKDERYGHDNETRWDFWLIGNAIDDVVRWMIESHGEGGGLIQNDGRIRIRVVTWGELLDSCEEQLTKQQERLNYASSQARSTQYAERAHADADVVRLLTAHDDSA
ncbi:ATP-binding protein [Streptomyces virginiae]|uniref:ATP-binding protein n=1 Tax=Streptomyces virginiae TaxID=1961 RepID=UPI002255366C|nr:ATP-binding protein [Streptomyces virginiae]MCX5174009.1 ATP-binding protein [Streptomyces virginiae]